jgi:hypothetical protein
MPLLPNLIVQKEGLAVQMDYAGGPGDQPTFVGLALPGTATASATWKIMKLTYSGSNLVQVLWADGKTQFDNVWDNHAGLSYS